MYSALQTALPSGLRPRASTCDRPGFLRGDDRLRGRPLTDVDRDLANAGTLTLGGNSERTPLPDRPVVRLYGVTVNFTRSIPGGPLTVKALKVGAISSRANIYSSDPVLGWTER